MECQTIIHDKLTEELGDKAGDGERTDSQSRLEPIRGCDERVRPDPPIYREVVEHSAVSIGLRCRNVQLPSI